MRKVVQLLLRLFPRSFREMFERDMLATFDDRWRDKRGWRVAARTILDLLTEATLERMSSRRERPPRRKGESSMTTLRQDLTFAIRALRRSPAFTIPAVVTLALGIGVNAAIFSVAHAVLWRSMPYPQPDRVVMVGEVDGKNPDLYWGASYPNFRDWQVRSTSFEHLAGILFDDRVLREGPEPSRVSGLAVSHDFFDVMEVAPELGRVFGVSDDSINAAPVIVLSHKLWIEQFGADTAILGHKIRFDNDAPTVIGVMPPAFDYRQAAFWTPIEQVVNPYFRSGRSVWVLNAVGRLRPGKTVAEAQVEVEGISRQIRRSFPETNRGLFVRVSPLRDELSRDLRPALLALLGAVLLVLFVACGNLAGLTLVRGSGRVRELGIRVALGVKASRLIRQLLTESALLAFVGGCAGVALSFWATRGLSALTKDPRLLDVSIDGPVLIFTLAVTVAATILFGVGPAIHAARVDVTDALKKGSRGNPQRALAQRFLVVSEIALCLVLLAGAGLLFKSFRRVIETRPGFRTENLITMRLGLPRTYNTPALAVQFYRRVSDSLSGIAGTNGVTLVNRLPITGGEANGDINIEGRPATPGSLGAATFRRITPNYFAVMGIPLVRGRIFSDFDTGTRGDVVMINESFAKHFWPNQDAIGARIKIGPINSGTWSTIVGVVGDVRQVGLDSEAPFSTYEPLAQHPSANTEVAIRSVADPKTTIPSIRGALRTLEPALIVDRVSTMSERLSDSVAPRRLTLVLFGMFAGLTLILAAVGLYGVVAHATSQRTFEFGLRMALGAQSADVLRLVLGQGLRLAAIGVVIGVAGAITASRVLTGLLFGVDPTDPWVLATVGSLLGLVAIGACWVPAYRASRIAPLEALRSE